MLAQSFMTAAQLGISDQELSALIAVLGMLDREEIPYAPKVHAPLEDGEPSLFNMACVISNTDCGTAACLAGWARHVGRDDRLFRHVSLAHWECRPDPLLDLFCMGPPPGPLHRGKDAKDILPSEAAIALRNYLTTGQPRWREAFELA